MKIEKKTKKKKKTIFCRCKSLKGCIIRFLGDKKFCKKKKKITLAMRMKKKIATFRGENAPWSPGGIFFEIFRKKSPLRR